MSEALSNALRDCGGIPGEDGSPLHFGSAENEVRVLREEAGLLDASRNGRLRIRGADRVDLLQRLATNDLNGMSEGSGRSSCLTTAKGRIVDRILVFAGADFLDLHTSPGRQSAVQEWLDRYTILEEVEVEDTTDQVVAFDLVGPRGPELIREFCFPELEDLPLYSFRNLQVDGVDIQLHRVEGLLTPPGYRLCVPSEYAPQIWNSMVSTGESARLLPVGSEALEAARIMAGIPVFGRDFGEADNPLEVGFWGSVSFNKGCYVGQEVIARLNTYDKVRRSLVRLNLTEGNAVQAGQTLVSEEKEVGKLTSVAGTPLLSSYHALGYVKRDSLEANTPIKVRAEDDAGKDIEISDLKVIRFEN